MRWSANYILKRHKIYTRCFKEDSNIFKAINYQWKMLMSAL